MLTFMLNKITACSHQVACEQHATSLVIPYYRKACFGFCSSLDVIPIRHFSWISRHECDRKNQGEMTWLVDGWKWCAVRNGSYVLDETKCKSFIPFHKPSHFHSLKPNQTVSTSLGNKATNATRWLMFSACLKLLKYGWCQMRWKKSFKCVKWNVDWPSKGRVIMTPSHWKSMCLFQLMHGLLLLLLCFNKSSNWTNELFVVPDNRDE